MILCLATILLIVPLGCAGLLEFDSLISGCDETAGRYRRVGLALRNAPGRLLGIPAAPADADPEFAPAGERTPDPGP